MKKLVCSILVMALAFAAVPFCANAQQVREGESNQLEYESPEMPFVELIELVGSEQTNSLASNKSVSECVQERTLYFTDKEQFLQLLDEDPERYEGFYALYSLIEMAGTEKEYIRLTNDFCNEKITIFEYGNAIQELVPEQYKPHNSTNSDEE